VRLETERLVLREPRLEDARAFDEFWQDEEASRFVGGVKSPQEVDEMMKRSIRHWEWFGIGNFTVERREDGAVLGRVGFLVWNPQTWENGHRVQVGEPRETELGWKLDRRAWGNGYASEAATACRDWGLGALGLTRLISLIALENTASIHVAERIGESFERELEPSPFSHPAGMWSLGERMAP
jgi:RimJ/RimL family protein N-acetyltransferase